MTATRPPLRSATPRAPARRPTPLRRRWRTRLRRHLVLLVGLIVATLVGAGAWALLYSSWFTAESVSVSGNETVSRREVVAAAAVDRGAPLARVDLEAVRHRIAALPAVARVEVHRDWPHTVEVTVVEREPLASVHRAGRWWVVDVEGVLFRRTRGPVESLPVVEAPADADAAAMTEVAAVVAALPADVLDATRRVQAPTRDSISLALRNGRTVVWGSAAESDRKAAVLEVLLRSKASKASKASKVMVYDVSVPELPTTRR